jgi:phosphoribosylformylglycinamidine synthase PurS subunit
LNVWVAKIRVTLRPVVNDPAGLSIADALRQLGFGNVAMVRTGKYFEVEFQADDRVRAEEQADQMCRRLLVNPVVEDYRFTLARRSKRAAQRSTR